MIEYDPHNWRSHLFDWRGSLVREILPRLTLLVVWTLLVTCYVYAVQPWLSWNAPLNHDSFGDLWKLPVSLLLIPITVHNLVGFALGLLLVFRTNSSYDRFWEGRKLWGGIVNDTRNLSRMACVHLVCDPALRNEIIRWTIAFPYALMHHLRGVASLGKVASRLDRTQAESTKSSLNVPLEVSRRISALLRRGLDAGHYGDVIFQAIDTNVHLLVGYLGACERIHKTPLPYAYMVHLRRAVIIYLYTLPLALVRDFGWGTPIAVAAVGFLFFGIEEIGVEIEDPFEGEENDIPLENICAAIDRQLSEHIGESANLEKGEA